MNKKLNWIKKDDKWNAQGIGRIYRIRGNDWKNCFLQVWINGQVIFEEEGIEETLRITCEKDHFSIFNVMENTINPIFNLLKEYKKSLEDGAENLGSLKCDELQEKAELIINNYENN